MDYFPLFLNLKQQSCMIVGGGNVAVRKTELLLSTHARVTVIAPTLHPTLIQWQQEGWITTKQRTYQPGDETGQRLVIAATDKPDVNMQILTECEKQNILVNVVDQQDACRFIVPSIIDRSPLLIAISSAGKAPMLARQLRARMEAWLPHGYGKLADLAGRMREKVKAHFPSNPLARRRFWEKSLEGIVAEQALAGNIEKAEQTFLMQLSNSDDHALSQGCVYLVGAGPGNPDLLTFRALRLMQQADVVLYDNLVSADIVQLVRRDAEKIYVGKIANNHPLPQEEINQLMVTLAKTGKAVLRLKGGDPFIFGRGGEEIEELVEANIPFEVVPGITSAAGASCYAGIPLTHRDYAQGVTFVTGHRRAGKVELNWPRLTSETETLVVYMGVRQASDICHQLIAYGRAPSTPVALIERATTTKQRVIIGTLETLPEKITQENVKPPALIIIGEVVQLHAKLGWYNSHQ